MTHLRLGTRISLEPSNKWSFTIDSVSLFSHRSQQVKVHLEELNLSQEEPSPEDTVGSCEEAEEVRGEGSPRGWVCGTP